MVKTNLEDVLEKFENGERRYNEDPNFKTVADSLCMGIGVYALLDHELKESAKRRQVFEAALGKTDNSSKTLKKIIYLTGPQGSGKTTLVNMTKHSLELDAVDLIVQKEQLRSVLKFDARVLFLTGQNFYDDISAEIQNFCELNDLKFEDMTVEKMENVNKDKQ